LCGRRASPGGRRELDADALLARDRSDREAGAAERVRPRADRRPAGIGDARDAVADEVVGVAVDAQR
jgi:hypothetical protein